MPDFRSVPVRRNVGGRPLGLAQELRDLVAHRFLLHQLVWRDLTVRYRRSYLGFLWTMMHPLLMMLIFVVVFSLAFRFPTPHYETYFLSEYVAWMFFSQTTVNAMVSVAWNGPLMKRVFVPKTIFPISSTLAGLVNFSLSLLLLVVIMAIVGAPIHATILFLPVSLAILGIFTLGASLALCALAVYFVDVREMYQAALPAIFYLTPVVYPIDIVPEIFRPVIKLNPMIYLLEIVRDPIYYGILPSSSTTMISTFVEARSDSIDASVRSVDSRVFRVGITILISGVPMRGEILLQLLENGGTRDRDVVRVARRCAGPASRISIHLRVSSCDRSS